MKKILSIFKREKKLNSRWWLLIWPVIVGVLVGMAFFFWKNKDSSFNFLSPLGTSPLSFLSPSKHKEVIGFLPYWNVKKLDSDSFDWSFFTQIIFFGLSIDESGNLVYRSEGKKDLGALWLEGEGLKKILDKARTNKVKTLLVIKSFDNEVIDNIITESTTSAKAVENITAKVLEYNFDGVNLDFEYLLQEEIADDSGQKLVEFANALNKKLKTDNPQAILSVDLYPNAIFYDKPYDTLGLSRVCDQIIIMAYDFHQMGSDKTGPVAPLRAPLGSRSIIETLQAAFEKKVPAEKLILGIPLYGYEWQTVSEKHRANAYPRTGVMASYKRVKDLIATEKLSATWDSLAMSPWLVYEKDNETRQVYFENDRSINLKLELTRQANLGGVAFWALGYEGQDSSFWQMVKHWQEKR